MKFVSILAGAVLVAGASSASAEVVSTSATGFQLRSTAVLESTTSEQAWAALG